MILGRPARTHHGDERVGDRESESVVLHGDAPEKTETPRPRDRGAWRPRVG